MCPCLWRYVVVSALAVARLSSSAEELENEADRRPIKLGMVPDLRPDRRLPPVEPQIRRIKSLIANLSNLDKPDFGLSTTLSGEAFAPIAGQEHASMLLLTDHRIEPSETLKAIVSIGPRAIPYLLESLDDQTPTKIVVSTPGFGVMHHATELHLNPVNSAEKPVYESRRKEAADPDDAPQRDFIDSYVLKVGDICFVAIGQIVGRHYSAVRYQPTAIIVLNCPTHTPELCSQVRKIWKSDDARNTIFKSLLEDYSTEGVHRGNSLDSWAYGSQFQSPAALRLLYYFPDETAKLIADRLDRLDVRRGETLNHSMQQCVANGVRAEEFIKAVAWCKESQIEAALIRLFRRAGESDCLLAALPAVKDSSLVQSRLKAFIAALPVGEGGPYGDGYRLLVALAERSPDTAKSVFEEYASENLQRRRTLCAALNEVSFSWDIDLLVPLLSDKRTFGWTYAVVPSQNEPRLPIRICDEAATTLAKNHPALKFVQAGDHKSLDEQIEVMKAALASKK